jgi:hypothetical protein
MIGLVKQSRQQVDYEKQAGGESEIDPSLPYQVRMREGLARFKGEILLFMSGRSLIGKELDEAVASSKRWREVVSGSRIQRVDMKDADHTFSRAVDRQALIERAASWLLGE